MNSLYRWWRKYGNQLVGSLVSLLIAFYLYYSQGNLLNETLYRFSQSWSSPTPFDRQALYENQTIEELTNKIIELQAENDQLKELLNYTKNSPQKLVPTKVIGRSPDAWWQMVTINIGEKQGVKENNVVMGIGGLVGRVTNVTENTSRVLLISDYNSRVGITLSRTRYQGFIKGQSSPVGVIEFYSKVTDVKIGDTLTTSALSTIYPGGIPVGKIISVDLNRSPAPTAEVLFSAPINFLEWLVVAVDSEPNT